MKNQIVIYARVACHIARQARQARKPFDLLNSVSIMAGKLWDAGCHNDIMTADEKQCARRCAVAIEKMIQ